jgi:hypothetical protein
MSAADRPTWEGPIAAYQRGWDEALGLRETAKIEALEELHDLFLRQAEFSAECAAHIPRTWCDREWSVRGFQGQTEGYRNAAYMVRTKLAKLRGEKFDPAIAEAYRTELPKWGWFRRLLACRTCRWLGSPAKPDRGTA